MRADFCSIGSNLPPIKVVEQDEERVAKLLDECPIGGLLLFNGGPDTKQTLERLQQRMEVPLLVGSDVERGVGQQVKGYTLFPHAMAFEKLGANSETAIADFARSIAKESRDVGIHIVFGPVADVATNPLNPIIATRAFSESPHRAAELSRAVHRCRRSCWPAHYRQTLSGPRRYAPGFSRCVSQC